MLQNTLSTIKQILKNEKIEENEIESILKALESFKEGEYIYPGVIKRKTRIDIHKIYKILDILVIKSILERNFEIYCHRCNKYAGEIFRLFSEIPKIIECFDCEKSLSISDNVIVIYRIVS